ncbi:hypothetical protein [Actinospica robiniae]|uniref:hypothetical protein n=1 Tax=Actinospica robiniae TaxID=304901 RepID=UPI00040C568B|nr:hypothetical protein [Actinospica robiniae]
MHALRLALGLGTAAATAAAAVLGTSTAASATSATPAASTRAPSPGSFEFGGLTVQESNGYYAATGPAAAVRATAAKLAASHLGNTAFFTGAKETGAGIVVVTGDSRPEGTDFRIANLTAASVVNNSTDQDAVYWNAGEGLDVVVAPGASASIPPDDVDFALYPVGATPPPDNRGLIPNAQFTWNPSLG